VSGMVCLGLGLAKVRGEIEDGFVARNEGKPPLRERVLVRDSEMEEKRVKVDVRGYS